MKKLLILALALLMIVSLAACKGNDPGSTGTNPPASSTGDNQQSGNESGNSNTSQSGNNAEAAKLTGKLNL
ncbi:MAG: peptide ABC transporter substrate-binding protein, partial [Clostridia bacterium]|nr:peptide ABC transporter substrate-binding protein [Clostridia bacterium]